MVIRSYIWQRKQRAAIFTGLWITLLASFALTVGTAQAQEEPAAPVDQVIYEDTTGPYLVRVSQSPARAIVGIIRLTVEPMDAATGAPVEDAVVRIFGNPPSGGERQFSPGLNSPADRSLYFGQIELDDAGMWAIDIEIDAAQGRALAIAQTEVHERARSGSNATIGGILFFLVSAGFVGGGLWLWYTSKKARKRRDAIRRAGGRPTRSSG